MFSTFFTSLPLNLLCRHSNPTTLRALSIDVQGIHLISQEHRDMSYLFRIRLDQRVAPIQRHTRHGKDATVLPHAETLLATDHFDRNLLLVDPLLILQTTVNHVGRSLHLKMRETTEGLSPTVRQQLRGMLSIVLTQNVPIAVDHQRTSPLQIGCEDQLGACSGPSPLLTLS